ncbi:hypothetical protein P3T37_005352 [Kitasatospora sp. MAA4]|uniref:hypothetical protein n=1 Tax=Kitasatospora sp. MAA4 TaxID=3035093 RepID=UPI002476EF4A|nr:hypothetical protein [Kitasatospora sp. MAA4]MDH6135933.1 hypothetical protein [Kitasatospora sp. MAA4]
MSSGKNSDERNPFAPPPEDAPDQPWRPRIPQRPAAGGRPGAEGEQGGQESGEQGQPGRPPVPPPHPWSPNWQGGGGPGWPERPQAPQQPRFDPNDPVHRRSRYALASGMASMFCGLAGIQYVALLLGVLALYWGVSALRAAGKDAAPATAPDATTTSTASTGDAGAPVAWPYGQRTRPQAPAALGGLLTGGVAVALVMGSFALNVAYKPYFTCLNDALTTTAEQSCSTLAPQWLVSYTNPPN